MKIKDQKDKKWEAKKEVEIRKTIKMEESSPADSTMLECKGTNPILQFSAPIDMSTMLSQMIVKIPLFEMFKIKEHKSKAVEWINSIKQHDDALPSKIVDENVKIMPEVREPKGIFSQIPPKYLDNAMTAVVEDIDPFMLSLIVNGKILKNCMIDSGASNTVMPFRVMESLGLRVDTKQGKCCAMDSREVLVIGTINALPYKLVVYPNADLTMTVLVIDIPPKYGMLLSRQWSAAMGGSL